MKTNSVRVALGAAALVLLAFGCSTRHVVHYPPASDIFVTPGDDPGTESHTTYIPKGYYYYRYSGGVIPLPLFGLIPAGNPDPQMIFDKIVLPDLHRMGADALIDATITVRPPPGWFWRFLGIPLLFTGGGSVTVQGTAVKRPRRALSTTPRIQPRVEPGYRPTPTRPPRRVTPPPARTVQKQPKAKPTGARGWAAGTTLEVARNPRQARTIVPTWVGKRVRLMDKTGTLYTGTLTGFLINTLIIRTGSRRPVSMKIDRVLRITLMLPK